MASTFKAMIEDLTGTIDSRVDLDELLVASGAIVADALPMYLKIQHARKQTVTDANGYDIRGKNVIAVDREGNPSSSVPPSMSGKLSDVNSMHAASNLNPMHFIDSNNLYIKPDPAAGGDDDGHIFYFSYPAFSEGDVSINYFPDEAEYAVVLCAALKVLQTKLNILIHTDEDPELAGSMQAEIVGIQTLYDQELKRLGGGR